MMQPLHRGMPRMLASVRTASEAQLALAAGAAVIDAKEPRAGALGALPPAVIADIVRTVAGRALVSATVGDLPLDPALLGPAMRKVAASGVDLVKIGLFGIVAPATLTACLAALPTDLPGPDGRRARRIAVLMADQDGASWPLAPFARHGFHGVMLDTADKSCGGLRAVLDQDRLLAFVAAARALDLQVGLAGSLGLDDIAPLAALRPDYLGFRTALCHDGIRQGELDPLACERVAALCSAQAAGDSGARPGAPDQPR